MILELFVLILSFLGFFLYQKQTSDLRTRYENHSGVHDYEFEDFELKFEFIQKQPVIKVDSTGIFGAENQTKVGKIKVCDLVEAIVVDCVFKDVLKVEVDYLSGLLTNVYTNSSIFIKKYITLISKRRSNHYVLWYFLGIGGGNIYTLNTVAYIRNMARIVVVRGDYGDCKDGKVTIEDKEVLAEDMVTMLLEYCFFYIGMIPLITTAVENALVSDRAALDNKSTLNNDVQDKMESREYWKDKFEMKCPVKDRNLEFMAAVCVVCIKHRKYFT